MKNHSKIPSFFGMVLFYFMLFHILTIRDRHEKTGLTLFKDPFQTLILHLVVDRIYQAHLAHIAQ